MTDQWLCRYKSLLRILLRVASLYHNRGSVKLACYFYQQAADLSDSIGSPRLRAKILARQIDLYGSSNRAQEFEEALVQLRSIASTVSHFVMHTCARRSNGDSPGWHCTPPQEGGLSSIEVLDLNARAAAKALDCEDAEKASATALKSLIKLDKAFVESESQFVR